MPFFGVSAARIVVANRAGARVRFADVLPDTFGIDPASVERLLDDSVRAVVGVHYAGIGCEHVAHPQGEARILVVEKAGSV